MDLLTFPLFPFPGESTLPELTVSGAIGLLAGTLTIRHTIEGDLSGLAIPLPAEKPERRNRLWEESCLEFFIGETESAGYLEFNLSPAGHWNVYRFDACRNGMREDEGFDVLPFRVTREPGTLTLTLAVDLGRLFPPGIPLSAAVAAVVRTSAGDTSHWALAHPGPAPDFHRRDGFLLDLPV